MQVRTSVINFHKHTSNVKTLLDQYHSTFGKGTRSIKVTPPIKVTPFHGNKLPDPTEKSGILSVLQYYKGFNFHEKNLKFNKSVQC